MSNVSAKTRKIKVCWIFTFIQLGRFRKKAVLRALQYRLTIKSMKQPSLFDTPEIHIDKPIRLIELFGGIGAQAMALRDIGANFEHYRLIEFDKYPVASYNAIHKTHFTPQDITKISGKDLGIVDVENYTYLLTYSFPCQDLSLAGNRKGMAKGSGTRSGLLWEVERLLNEVENLPQVLLMENVPQVHGEKNRADFYNWIQYLTKRGYSSFWQDLNSKDFGVAQSRKRCFMVSFLGDWEFDFPDGFKLDKTMKDYLEKDVDEKYYINTDKAREMIKNLVAQNVFTEIDRYIERETVSFSVAGAKRIDIANCITAREDRGISNRARTGSGVIELQPH